MKPHAEWDGERWKMNHRYKVTRRAKPTVNLVPHDEVGLRRPMTRKCTVCNHKQFNYNQSPVWTRANWIDVSKATGERTK